MHCAYCLAHVVLVESQGVGVVGGGADVLGFGCDGCIMGEPISLSGALSFEGGFFGVVGCGCVGAGLDLSDGLCLAVLLLVVDHAVGIL